MMMDVLAEKLRRMKLDRVRQHGDAPDADDACDLPVVAIAVRDGDQVAHVIGGEGPEAGRTAIYYAAAMFGAQEVLFAGDGRMRAYPKGTEAPPDLPMGELSRLWAAGQRQDIRECLMVYKFTPEGAAGTYAYPYRRVGRLLIWDEPELSASASLGAIPDHAAAGFAASADFQMMAAGAADIAEMMGLTPEQRQVHQDRAVGRLVSTYPHVGAVVVFARGSDAMFIDGAEEPL